MLFNPKKNTIFAVENSNYYPSGRSDDRYVAYMQ